MTSDKLCPSCQSVTQCTADWPVDVPRPDSVAAGAICEDCAVSAQRYAVLQQSGMRDAVVDDTADVEAAS